MPQGSFGRNWKVRTAQEKKRQNDLFSLPFDCQWVLFDARCILVEDEFEWKWGNSIFRLPNPHHEILAESFKASSHFHVGLLHIQLSGCIESRRQIWVKSQGFYHPKHKTVWLLHFPTRLENSFPSTNNNFEIGKSSRIIILQIERCSRIELFGRIKTFEPLKKA